MPKKISVATFYRKKIIWSPGILEQEDANNLFNEKFRAN